MKYTKKQIDQIVKDLGGNEREHNDGEAFDIAEGVLLTNPGLEESIKQVYGVQDPKGWLADRCV
jgi:hypothetical protein